jgi:hypothetical protein
MASDRELHPEGKFPAKIMEHAIQTASTGTDQLAVRFETEYGSLWAWYAFTEDAAPHTVKKIRAMGYQGDDIGELADGIVLVGNECEVTVKHEMGRDGRPRAKVTRVSPPGGDKMVSDERATQAVRKYNALLRSVPPRAKEDVPF